MQNPKEKGLMMKTTRLLFLSFLLFYGCTTSNNSLKGSGNIVSETKNISYFNRIEVGGPINVFISQGEDSELRIETDDNLISLIKAEMDGDLLRVHYVKPSGYSRIETKKGLNVFVRTSDLIRIRNFGSGVVSSKTSFRADEIEMENTGSGTIRFDLYANTLNAQNKGSGRITLKGNVDHQNIAINGSGEYSGLALQSESASIVIMGSGSATVSVEKELSAQIMGSGNIQYRGAPKITSQVIGSGIIKKL